MEEFLKKAKESSRIISQLTGKEKNKILLQMAEILRKNDKLITEENKKDMINADKNNLSIALKDRLLLTTERIESMAVAIEEISQLKEPVGKILDGWITDDDLKIEKVSVPIGVIGIIYESRPNVTSDTAALCFKSGNACVLKGGKEAQYSNEIIAKYLREVLESNNLPKEIISLLPDASREGVSKLIKMDKFVDLIVPRGGESLIRYISQNSSVPVIKHDKGQCHIYVHKDANMDNVMRILINAKCQRPGVCNSMETVLIDRFIAKEFLPKLKKSFDIEGTKLKGCCITQKIIDVGNASDEDFHTEYLSNILNIKVVEDID